MNKPFLSVRDCTQIVFTTLMMSISLPLLATSSAQAAGSNMPWEQPLQQVLQSVEGPVAKIIAVSDDQRGLNAARHGRRQ
jgi:type IV secretory pathway VirB2 component (pilin)